MLKEEIILQPITIQNARLSVTVDPIGAVLCSVMLDGAEYLWQGDPAYWRKRDVNLFPCVGRLTGGQYTHRGRAYSMPTHGFCAGAEFTVARQTAASVELLLSDSPETRAIYPFAFALRVRYALEDNRLVKTCTVENHGDDPMYFALGSHPGFQVPLCGDGDFSDWYLEFSEPCRPSRILFHPETVLLADENGPYALEDGRRLKLTHSCFDDDAIFLKNTARQVALRSAGSAHSITVDFPGMPFIGFWHMPNTDAPYVCIEPWTSLPSRHGIVEELAEQPYLIALPGGGQYENAVSFTFT